MTGSAELTVVLGTYNRLESLKRCLASVVAETTTPTTIYVTDAGSTDGTQEYLRDIASNTIIPLLRGKKLGQARAYNEVFEMTTTPYVVWISDDNEIVNRGLDRAVAVLKGRSDIGMVGLKVKDRQGPFVKAPYIGGLTSAGVLNINQGVLPTKLLRDIGYFSEVFGFYGIDADLTTKVLHAGKTVVLTKDVAIQHYRDWADASTTAGVALRANQDRSIRLYKKKYGEAIHPGWSWDLKKKLWERLKTRYGARLGINAPQPIWGALPRDWYNTFNGRYIGFTDPWMRHLRDYYLVQKVPKSARRALIPDSELTDD